MSEPMQEHRKHGIEIEVYRPGYREPWAKIKAGSLQMRASVEEVGELVEMFEVVHSKMEDYQE